MAQPTLVFVLDTATDVAVFGIVDTVRGEVLAEGRERPVELLARADELFATGGLAPSDVNAVVVGIGPGRYTSLRIGVASARALATGLGVPIAGVSTLAALQRGAPDPMALIDARRGEVFARDHSADDGHVCCAAPSELRVDGRTCVGDGAIAYRDVLEARGALVPGDADARHQLAVHSLVQAAGEYGSTDAVEPAYLRMPDAERTRKEFPKA